MAQFNPQYVNLNGYEAAQLQRRANQVSPLDALIQGAQQGLQLQQLPQQLQDQQLARQLNNLLVTQKIKDLQNPQAALARKLEEELTLKGALNPNLGIQRAPAGLVGETIANPGALTQEQQASLPSADLLSLRDQALTQGGVTSPQVVIPTAPAAGLSETPISAFGIQTGLTSNPNIPAQAAQDKLDRQIQLANSRARTAGIQGQFMQNGDEMVFVQKPTIAGGLPTTTTVPSPTGGALKVPIKNSKPVLALDESGILQNVVLQPGESLPDGYKKYERPSAATNDPVKFYQAVKKDPIVKDFLDISPQYAKMQSALEESKAGGPLTAVDQTLINTFNKILDPRSVVRESEYSRTASDQGVLDYLKGKFGPDGKLALGGAGLTPEVRQAMLTMAERFYNAAKNNYDHSIAEWGNLADAKGFSRETVIPTALGNAQLNSPASAPSSSKGSSISGTSGTSRNGIKFQLIK